MRRQNQQRKRVRGVKILHHPIYPALIWTFPVISLAYANIQVISPRSAFRAIIVLAGLAILFHFMLKRLFKSSDRAALISSATALSFMSYGHLLRLLDTWLPSIFLALAVPLGITLSMIAITIYLSCRLNSLPPPPILNLCALVLILLPTMSIAHFELIEGKAAISQASNPEVLAGCALNADSPGLPDIYYVVLDGYARLDVLEELYGFENAPFIDSLRSLGFVVSDYSISNYSQTHLSLASVLNLDYVQNLLKSTMPEDTDHKPITRLIQKSQVAELFRACGYQLITFETGYRRTEILDSEVFVSSDSQAITPFESQLIGNSIFTLVHEVPRALGWQTTFPGYRAHRELIDSSFATLSTIPEWNGSPKLVLAHIVSPHPPFVFDSDGNAIDPPYPFLATDGDQFPGTRAEYLHGFREQTAYVNSRVLSMVRALLADPQPKVIVLQSDHGPGSELNWVDPRDTNYRERMSILNAIYLPGLNKDLLPSDFSQVNTFRLILNHRFQPEFGLLENRSYFSSWIAPYDFHEYRQMEG